MLNSKGVLLHLSLVMALLLVFIPHNIVHAKIDYQDISPAADTTPPVIQIWYGDYQVFGSKGTPQKWINILGNVSDAESLVSSLEYQINGVTGSPPLTLGPTSRRLPGKGDFNVELDRALLNNGLNTLVLTARNSDGLSSTKNVTIQYNSTTKWPLPYVINWATVNNIQDVVQIVDGIWTKTPNGLRTTQVAYDRVIAIGDMSWTDYEVTIPMIIHGIDTTSFGSDTSGNGPSLGLTLRWQGHTNNPDYCLQPLCGWNPNGGRLRYSWNPPPSLGQLRITAEPPLGTTSNSSFQFQIGGTYWFKTQVQTDSSVSMYRLKAWANGTPEPSGWIVERQATSGNLGAGSLLLVAHHVDVTFGNITVTQVGETIPDPDPDPDPIPPPIPLFIPLVIR